eukprot:3322452-Pyramimonas_sp.AAC.1
MKQDKTSNTCEGGTSEASKKRSRPSDADPAAERTPSLLSAPQIAVFLNNRPDLNKPVTNDELRRHIKTTLNINDEIPKAALKSTLRQIVTARQKKRKVQSGKEVGVSTSQPQQPENYLKGDWKCPICANHNWAKRKDCVKCSAPHPDSAAARREAAIKVRACALLKDSFPTVKVGEVTNSYPIKPRALSILSSMAGLTTSLSLNT